MKIRVTKNGPYIVSGGVPLTAEAIVLDADGQPLGWRETKRYPVPETYSLCRCGKSKNRPFCDGSHTGVNFDGAETATRLPYLEQCERLTGPTLDLTDAKPLCVHAGFCDRASGIWKLVPASDDPQSRRIAIEEAINCPSGRLVVWDKDGRPIEPAFAPSIVIVESATGEPTGTLWVRGGIAVESANGETYEIRNRVTLCGCGRSANKPFCDGTHRNQPSR